jgi:hypothetical protein
MEPAVERNRGTVLPDLLSIASRPLLGRAMPPVTRAGDSWLFPSVLLSRTFYHSPAKKASSIFREAKP